MSASDARRAATALSAAREQVAMASSAAIKYRHSGGSRDWRGHVIGLSELVNGMEIASLLIRDLAEVAKACADDARMHYFHGADPDGKEWPDGVKEAACGVDQALSRLRSHLEKTRVDIALNTLACLHAAVQNARRIAAKPQG